MECLNNYRAYTQRGSKFLLKRWLQQLHNRFVISKTTHLQAQLKCIKKMNLSMFCVYCEVVNPFCLF